MARRKKIKRSQKAGLLPGTLMHLGTEKEASVNISLYTYNENTFHNKTYSNVQSFLEEKELLDTQWININGIHDLKIVETLGNHFHLHPLILEDITNSTERTKIEEHDNCVFIILKMYYYAQGNIESEQVSLILKENSVISFQEREGDVFESIRQTIVNGKGKLRKLKADYLFYRLIDSIIDNYFIILEKIEERIYFMEEDLISNTSQQLLNDIYSLRREVNSLRRSIRPLRELVKKLQSEELALITEATSVYLRDVHDHTIQIIDTIDSFRDILSGLFDIYLSKVNNKMNEVMKFLTSIATIFIPLSFIVGVYGMNFKNMPELEWKYGYFGVLFFMFSILITMLIIFRKKKWF